MPRIHGRPWCLTCPYWGRVGAPESREGECRRYPPVAVGFAIYEFQDGNSRGWGYAARGDPMTLPVTPEDHWCGEHPDAAGWIASEKANP